jgi:hypothetical protein
MILKKVGLVIEPCGILQGCSIYRDLYFPASEEGFDETEYVARDVEQVAEFVY